jgi:hypothetical protein
MLFLIQALMAFMITTAHFGVGTFTADTQWETTITNFKDKNFTRTVMDDTTTPIIDLLNFAPFKTASDFIELFGRALNTPQLIMNMMGIPSGLSNIFNLLIILIYVGGVIDLIRGTGGVER